MAAKTSDRYIVRETLQGSFAVRDTKTGLDFRTCTGQSRFAARSSAQACADNLNGGDEDDSAPATVSADPVGVRLLVTTAHPSLYQHELDGEIHPNLGRLIQPRHTSSIELTAAQGIAWAADNDCFQGLDEAAYVRMLDRIAGLDGCRFVTVPDRVGDATWTSTLFAKWIGELDRRELPAAYVLQDGLTGATDPRIPWDRIAAVFVGGTDDFKLGPIAAEIAREAKARGKWVHWGRVNSRKRFDYIVSTGAVDSFDGSKWARFRKTYLDGGLEWCLETSADEVAARNALVELAVAGKLTIEPAPDVIAELDGKTILIDVKTAADTRQKGETVDSFEQEQADKTARDRYLGEPYRFTVDTPATDDEDAAILADGLESFVRDERNDPAVPVTVTVDAPGDRGTAGGRSA